MPPQHFGLTLSKSAFKEGCKLLVIGTRGIFGNDSHACACTPQGQVGSRLFLSETDLVQCQDDVTSMSHDPTDSPLAELFCQFVPQAQSHWSKTHLDAALQRLWTLGRAQFPSFSIDDKVLLTLLVACLPPQADWPEDLTLWLDGRNPVDLYLAAACLSRDEAAIAYLEREHIAKQFPPISRPEMRSELLQRVRIKLLGATGLKPALATYKGRSPLDSFLRVVVRNIERDMHDSQPPTVPLDDTPEIAAQFESPTENVELGYLKTTYRAEFRRCLEQAVRQLEPQQRNLLRMSLVHRMTTTEIGQQLGVNQSTISRWLSAIQQELGQTTQQCMRERLNLNREEYESLMRVIRSRLDASMERWLSESRAAPGSKE